MRLSETLGLLYLWSGRYGESKAKLETAVEFFRFEEAERWPESENAIARLGDYGLACYRVGELSAASEAVEAAFSAAGKNLGPSHARTRDLASLRALITEREEVMLSHHKGVVLMSTGSKRRLSDRNDETISINSDELLMSQSENEGDQDVETVYQQALMERMQMQEEDHLDTRVAAALHRLLRNPGELEAKMVFERLASRRENMLGPGYLDTLANADALGSVLWMQRKYEEAKEIYRGTIELEDGGIFGLDHLDMLTRAAALGWAAWEKGENEKAEEIYRRMFELGEKELGPRHLYTLARATGLGWVLWRKGKYEEAEAMDRRTLELKEEVLGLEHPYTLESVYRLGRILDSRNKYEEAEIMLRRALEARDKVLGREHQDTLVSVVYLSWILICRGSTRRLKQYIAGRSKQGRRGCSAVVAICGL